MLGPPDQFAKGAQVVAALPAEHGWLTAHLSGAGCPLPPCSVRSVLALPAAAEESVRWRATEGVWSVDTHVDLHLVIDGVVLWLTRPVVLSCILLYKNENYDGPSLRGDCPLVRDTLAAIRQMPSPKIYSDIGHTIYQGDVY